MKTMIKGSVGQTIFDIAIQHYGSTEGLGFLIEDNPDILQSEKVEGLKIFIRDSPINKTLKNYFNNKIIVTI